MKMQIKFVSGEIKDQCFPLELNQALSIGRSHTNRIVLTSPDISGRHVIVRLGADGKIHMEVLSSRITKYNGKNAGIGDTLDVSAGDTVQMGEHTAFSFEPVNADDDKTVLQDEDAELSKTVASPASTAKPVQATTATKAQKASSTSELNSDDSSSETIAIQTRVASEEELEDIKNSYRLKARKRVILWTVAIAMFLGMSVSMYFHLKPETEEHVSWPVNANGRRLQDYTFVPVPGIDNEKKSYLALFFPASRSAKIEKKNFRTDVWTYTGKNRDVLLHIEANSKHSNKNLFIDHDEAIQQWMRKQRTEDPTLSWGVDRVTIFVNRSSGAGIPLTMVSYTRRLGNDDFFGYAVFLRNAANTHQIMIEVPLQYQWRADQFLRRELIGMVIIPINHTVGFWEGSSVWRKNTTVAQDLEEAKSFLRQEAPVYWGKVFYRLRSALIKATAAGDINGLNEAKQLLAGLRARLSVWYNAQKLAYQYAEQSGDNVSMQSIQATCESVFSAEFQQADFRYDLIKRKEWK